MKFESVEAHAFGPFKNETITFGPGFNIVHGLNESGKSTWAAALYASLAGRRRARGRGSKEDSQFRARHKPWTGSRWQVSAHVSTDDGSRLGITQDLAGGTTRVFDVETSLALDGTQLSRRFGISPSDSDDIDASQIFGLTRGTLRATTFVPQADVLRVLEQAGELQEFLQRAASTQTIDVTAPEVIETLREQLSTRVGSLNIGNRPLRRSTQEFSAAENRAYLLRQQRDQLRHVAASLSSLTGEEGAARLHLNELVAHQGWIELDELLGRIAKVQDFDHQLEPLAALPAGAAPEQLERVRSARAAFLSLGAAPPNLTGPTAAEIEQELEQLPQPPEGDTSPDPAARRAWEELRRRVAALEGHDSPAKDAMPSLEVPLSSDELRARAAVLSAPGPTWNPQDDEREASLRAQHAAAQQTYASLLATWTESSDATAREAATYATSREQHASDVKAYDAKIASYRGELRAWEEALEARAADHRTRRQTRSEASRPSSPRWASKVGFVLLLIGIAAFFLEPIAGIALTVVGLGLVAWGLIGARSPASTSTEATKADEPLPPRPTAPTSPTPPEPPALASPGERPAPPVISQAVEQITERRAAYQAESSRVTQARECLERELTELGLPSDADELLTLARAVDEQSGALKAAEQHRALGDNMKQAVESARIGLVDTLQARGVTLDDESPTAETAEEAYRTYELACRQRAQLAAVAGRRTDVEKALGARRPQEAAHTAEVTRIAAGVSAVLEAAREVTGDGVEEPESAAEAVQVWLAEQADTAQKHELRARLQSLRAQLLDGQTPEELQSQAQAAQENLPQRPEGTTPENLALAVSAARTRWEVAQTERSSTKGHLDSLRTEEQDLASAIEEAALRQRNFTSIEELRDTLSLAVEHLDAAQGEAHRSLAPALEDNMRRGVPLLMQGRYRDVRVDPADLTVQLQEQSGKWRDAAVLSQGTTEQTFLLLRLALVQYLGSGETMPLVLDDVTVQSDHNRTVALLELLADLAQERQIILLSQERGVVQWAQEHLHMDGADRMIALPSL